MKGHHFSYMNHANLTRYFHSIEVPLLTVLLHIQKQSMKHIHKKVHKRTKRKSPVKNYTLTPREIASLEAMAEREGMSASRYIGTLAIQAMASADAATRQKIEELMAEIVAKQARKNA